MHQPVRIHDSDGNPITATNPLEVDVKTLAAPATLPLPAGAATQTGQDAIAVQLTTMAEAQQDQIALLEIIAAELDA